MGTEGWIGIGIFGHNGTGWDWGSLDTEGWVGMDWDLWAQWDGLGWIGIGGIFEHSGMDLG